jgi:hypothetical protein
MCILFCTAVEKFINLVTFEPPETFLVVIWAKRTCSVVPNISHLSSFCNVTNLWMSQRLGTLLRFEIFTVMNIHLVVFSRMALYSEIGGFYAEDGGSMLL